MPSTSKKTAPVETLAIQNLGAVFPDDSGGLTALKDLSFSVYKHEFITVLGPSGSGKSTLLRILGGLLPATSGQVLYNGEPLAKSSREIGFVFQHPNLMPWRTVEENISLPLELQSIPEGEITELVKDMITLVGLNGFEQTLPRDLSGGMAQRVAIARALIHDPKVLLLDEPFGELDALTRERMGMELMRIWQVRRKTVVMVTHSISEALFLADRVLTLSPRPGTLRLDLPVKFNRPRKEEIRYTNTFVDMAHQLRDSIG